MAVSAPGLRPDEIDNLRWALSALAVLERSGIPLELWEAYSFATLEGSLFRRELRRLSAKETDVSTGFLEKLRLLRNNMGSLIGRLRKIVAAAVRRSQDPQRLEIILGLVATSPTGRMAAVRWLSDPERFEREASEKIRLLEHVVDSHHPALRAEAIAPEEAPAPPRSEGNLGSTDLGLAPVQQSLLTEATPEKAVEEPPRDAGPAAPSPAPPAPDLAIDPVPLGAEPLPPPPPNPPAPPDSLSEANAGVEGANSSEVSTILRAPPSAPKNLIAEAAHDQIVLSWSGTSGEIRYNLKRGRKSGGLYTTIARELDQPSFVDRSVRSRTTYYYVATALNAGGESSHSNEAEATPMPLPPAPTHLETRPGNAHVSISWAGSFQATSYNVWRSLASGTGYERIATGVAGTAYTDKTCENGTTYFYGVTAVNEVGESPLSKEAQSTPILSSVPIAPREDLDPAAAAARTIPSGKRDEIDPAGRIPVGAPRGGASSGLDLEKLLDLRRVGEIRAIFKSTAQKIEVWEVLSLVSQGGYEARRAMERLVRLKERGDSAELEEEAASFFTRILKARSQACATVEEIRKFIESLNVEGRDGETTAIALGFIVSSSKARQRAEEWLKYPDESRTAAAAYIEHALTLAQRYRRALDPQSSSG